MPKTHCFQGHEITAENTNKSGRCKLCAKAWRDTHRPEGIGHLCECGCGQYAGVYAQSHPEKGQIKGQPKKYLQGHGSLQIRLDNAKRRKDQPFCKYGHPVFPGSRYPNGRCIECSKEYRIKWKTENPEKYKALTDFWHANRDSVREAESHRRRKYKLTPERYKEMLQLQNNACAVCKELFINAPRVDHDHSCCSGKETCGKCVRGLLCHYCNALFGHAKDNITILENAISYLKETQCPTQEPDTPLELNPPDPTLTALAKLSETILPSFAMTTTASARLN